MTFHTANKYYNHTIIRRLSQNSAESAADDMPFFRINGQLIFFAHIPKTGGSSIEHALSSIGQISLSAKNRGPFPCTPQHFHAELYAHIFNMDIFDIIFTIVRNPYDRIISEYKWFVALREDVSISFDEWWVYYASRVNSDPYLFDNHLRRQVDFIHPRMIVYKFEDGLKYILDDILERVGVRESVHAPHLKKSDKSDVCIDPRTLKEIESVYTSDFKELSYHLNPTEVLRRRSVRIAHKGLLYQGNWPRRIRFAQRALTGLWERKSNRT